MPLPIFHLVVSLAVIQTFELLNPYAVRDLLYLSYKPSWAVLSKTVTLALRTVLGIDSQTNTS